MLFKGLGRALFAVHEERCVHVVRGAVQTSGRLALVGAELIMQSRAPKLLEGLKALITANRRLNAANATIQSPSPSQRPAR